MAIDVHGLRRRKFSLGRDADARFVLAFVFALGALARLVSQSHTRTTAAIQRMRNNKTCVARFASIHSSFN